MKIAVLSRNPRLYSTRRLVEAGTQRGHEMVVIDTLRAYMNIASHKPQIHYRGKPLEGFDAVIPRIGASVTFYGCAVLRQFEMMGVYPLNESVAIARSRDKLRSLQLLSRRGRKFIAIVRCLRAGVQRRPRGSRWGSSRSAACSICST